MIETDFFHVHIITIYIQLIMRRFTEQDISSINHTGMSVSEHLEGRTAKHYIQFSRKKRPNYKVLQNAI